MLLTAKHVLERLDGRHLLLELPDRFESVQIDPAALAENSQADSVVIALPAAALQWGIAFLVLDAQEEASLSDGDREIFVAMGFPVREAEQSMQQAKLGFGLLTYWSFEQPTAYRRLGLSPQTFLTTSFDRKNAFQAGMIRAMKKPEGMSGGALWRLWGPATEPPSLARGALAGILARYEVSPVKCMVSTRLTVLQKLAAELLARESRPPGSSRSDLTRAEAV